MWQKRVVSSFAGNMKVRRRRRRAEDGGEIKIKVGCHGVTLLTSNMA